MPSIVFFDVDKTLVRGYTGFYTTLVLIQKGVLKKRRIAQALYYRLLAPLHEGNNADLKKLYQIATTDMAGWHIDQILEIGRECFERWIRPRLYEEAIRLIEEHKRKGDFVYFVTSGPYMVVEIMAQFLKVQGHYSGSPVINDQGILTPEVSLPIYYREGKVRAAEEVLKQHQSQWSDCYFYSDSIDDIFLLEKVGHPHLVNPDKKLKKSGQERGWPVLHFSQVLGK